MARLIDATLPPRFAAGLNATGGGIKVIKKTRVRERVRT
jgi:hypothetical protein